MSITPRIHAHLHAYAAQTKHDDRRIAAFSDWSNRGGDTYSANVLYTPSDKESIIIEHLVSCTEGRVFCLTRKQTKKIKASPHNSSPAPLFLIHIMEHNPNTKTRNPRVTHGGDTFLATTLSTDDDENIAEHHMVICPSECVDSIK